MTRHQAIDYIRHRGDPDDARRAANEIKAWDVYFWRLDESGDQLRFVTQYRSDCDGVRWPEPNGVVVIAKRRPL